MDTKMELGLSSNPETRQSGLMLLSKAEIGHYWPTISNELDVNNAWWRDSFTKDQLLAAALEEHIHVWAIETDAVIHALDHISRISAREPKDAGIKSIHRRLHHRANGCKISVRVVPRPSRHLLGLEISQAQ